MSKNSTALCRLKQDFVRLKKDPVPYILAEPLPSKLIFPQMIFWGSQNLILSIVVGTDVKLLEVTNYVISNLF